jgi:sugar lactone lactonase YvrE
MSRKSNWWARCSVLFSLSFSLHAVQAAPCDDFRVLVSGYFSNVHVYDACTGAFLRNLDDTGRIQGAQAVKIGPDGLLWVVSEEADTLLRYDAATLDFVDTFARLPLNWGLTGVAFSGGSAYVSSYETSALREYDILTGLFNTVPLAGGTVLMGPDNGMIDAPDGKIYIPGYDSHNVVRFDPESLQYSQFAGPRDNGLRAARGLLLNPAGNKLYVTGERSNQVLRYNFPGGGLDKVINAAISTPTGMAWHPDGSLLVAGNSTRGVGVLKLDGETGEEKSLFIPVGSGGLSGPTYIAVIPKGPASGETPNPATIGSQYWLTGLGGLIGTRVEFEANTALGAAFGSAFNPAAVSKPRWGTIRIEFLSCVEAELTWQSSGEDSARFGNGGYRIERMLITPAVVECQRTGIAGAPNTNWLQGAWYGGPTRDGEGFMLDTDGAGLVFLTWFTYRPVQ